MPVQPCEQNGKPGYRWGETGACYTYTSNDEQSRAAAEEKAAAQGRAIKARQGASMAELQDEPMPMPGMLMPPWRMLAVDESKPTDDGRAFRAEGVLTWREPPFALTWTDEVGDGHDGAELGGTVERVERQGSQIWFYGTFTDDESGREFYEHVKARHPLFPSISIGDEVAVFEVDEQGRELLVYEGGKIVGGTCVPEPAQEGTFIELDEETPVGATPVMACAAAGGPPLYPPSEWFERPPLDTTEVTPPTVTDEGRIFGHLAGMTCLASRSDRCIRVTDANLARDFAVFHHGVDGLNSGIKTAEGTNIKVGQITLVGGHADVHLSAAAARKHYDETKSVVAHVRVGWDENLNLPWYSGGLVPGVTEEQVQMVRAVGVSGDWRDGAQLGIHDGKVHLIGLPAVPVPGFPPVRALVASGELQAFIARGPTEEEDNMDPQRFAELHAEAHRAEPQEPTAFAKAWATFQAGNVEALIEHACSTYKSMTECMDEAGQHAEDPGALCNWLQQQCGGNFGVLAETVAASAAVGELAQIAFSGLDRQVWEPVLAEMDRTIGAR